MTETLLEVVDLQTEIRRRDAVVKAVAGVSFSAHRGETIGLVGESGCGKTQSALSIMRLLPPGGRVTGGSVRLNGRELLSLDESAMRTVRGNEIGMVFQDPMTSLNPTMPIGMQVAESVRAHRSASKRAALRRAQEVLGLVGLPRPAERMTDYPHQLSGGLRQRVMIAIALACEPKLLIADEPTTALDVSIQAQILELLDTLKQQLSMGLLLITHDLGVIAGRADRVVVMYAGRVVETADTDTIFYTRRHPYTEALLASVPRMDQDASKRLRSIPGVPPDLSVPIKGCPFAARCGYATNQCHHEEPTLTDSDPGHRYACFHPVQTAAGSATLSGAQPLVLDRGSHRLPTRPGRPTTESDLLVLERVSKDYPIGSPLFRFNKRSISAVSDVSFRVRRGETFGLVGESGSGKTTIGRLVTGLERADSGRILFDSKELRTLSGRALKRTRQDLQLMFQDPYASLDPRMQVGRILSEPFAVQKIGSRTERKARIAQLLNEVGLPAKATSLYPHEFSGGQRQRIGFARALALSPSMIVADEPVSALDVSIRSQILNLMRSLQRDHGLTYIVISHDLSVVKYLADRIGVMYLGRLVEIGTAADIYARPVHPYTAGLLAAIPIADPRRSLTKHVSSTIKGDMPSPINPPSGCRFRTRCPRARPYCAESTPALRSFGGAHEAACHFPLHKPEDIGLESSSQS